jgi:hypothetical protein
VEEKLKEGAKTQFLKIHCRAPYENARQCCNFAVRHTKTHDKLVVFAVCCSKTHGHGKGIRPSAQLGLGRIGTNKR